MHNLLKKITELDNFARRKYDEQQQQVGLWVAECKNEDHKNGGIGICFERLSLLSKILDNFNFCLLGVIFVLVF